MPLHGTRRKYVPVGSAAALQGSHVTRHKDVNRARTPFDPPLDLTIRPSGVLLGGVLAVHAFFLVPAVWFALRQPAGWILPLLPLIAAPFAWRRLRLRTPRAVVRLVWEGGDSWRWYRVDGSMGRGRVASSSVRTPRLVILHLRPENGRRIETLLLAAGSVGETDFRRLRARLRLLSAA